MKNALIGFARGLGFAILWATLTYLGSAEHLAFLSPFWSMLISSAALAVEHGMSGQNAAFFGAVKLS